MEVDGRIRLTLYNVKDGLVKDSNWASHSRDSQRLGPKARENKCRHEGRHKDLGNAVLISCLYEI